MNKDLLKQIRADMTAALAAVAQKHNLKSLTAGNCSFDPSGCFTFKVEGVTKDGVDKDGARYNNERELFGLPPLGTAFTTSKGTCAIVGMKSGGNIIFLRGGQRFVAPVETIKTYLKG